MTGRRLLVLLAGAAVSQRIDRARNYPTTPVTCEDRTRRGCGRVAVVLLGGFSDVTHITPLGKYDAAHAADASNPLLRAWMNITAASLRHHVMRPLAAAYESGVDVFIYSWDPTLEDAYAAAYAPVAAGYAVNGPVLAKLPLLKATRPKACAGRPEAGRCAPRPCLGSSCGLMHLASGSWAWALREAHAYVAAHEKRRGFAYDVVHFGRPDTMLYKSLEVQKIPAGEVYMPAPRWGDFFFLMNREPARRFAGIYDVAESEYGCLVGCLLEPDRRDIIRKGRPGPIVQVDAQRWKSVFLIKRLNMTLVAPMSQPHEISPYRFLYDDCRFQPKPAGGGQTPQEQKVFLTSALREVGITRQNVEVLFAAPGRQPCPYVCIAFLPEQEAHRCGPDRDPVHDRARRMGPRPKAIRVSPRRNHPHAIDATPARRRPHVAKVAVRQRREAPPSATELTLTAPPKATKPPSCAGHGPARGCGRAAVALVGGFSDVTFHRDGKYDAAHATDPKKPLLAAWLDVTAQSNKYHVQRPLATAYGGADFFIYSWDASLEGAYATRYAPTAAAYADNAPVLAAIPHLKAARPRSCEGNPEATQCTKRLEYHRRFRSIGHMHVASASWAFAVREVHALITAHEKSRGFDYQAVYFGRPDVLMFESLPARALLEDEVFMPRPGWGDFFFYMPRLKARKFSKMYTVAETRWGCEIGCVTRANARKHTRQARLTRQGPRAGAEVDGQLWKSVYLRRRLNATLMDAMQQPNDVAPYRFFYERCMRFKPKGEVRAAFESVGITPEVLAVLVKPGAIPGNRVACAWACEAYPNSSAVPRAGCRAS